MNRNIAALIIAGAIVLVGWFVLKPSRKALAPSSPVPAATTESTTNPPAAVTSDGVATNAVSIASMDFTPTVISVPVGATVHWNNNDTVEHTITVDDASFDSGVVAPGANFTHVFDKTGTYAYHCSIHPDMHGTVIIR